MAVTKVQDPINDVELTMVEGVVDQISFKEISGGPDRYGNTHRAGVRIGDDWVNNINIKVKDGNSPEIRFNAGSQSSPDWVSLAVGDKVKIVVQESEYNGKVYFNAGVSKIKLVKKGEGVATKSTSSGSVKESYKPFDSSGIEVGHAINGALYLARNGVIHFTDESVAEGAKVVHNTSMSLKAEYAAKNTGMSEKDVGSMVGHAVLNACRDADAVDGIETLARDILDNVVPVVAEFVKASKAESKEEKPAAKKTPAKKTPAKKTTTKKEPVKDATPEAVDDADIPEGAFIDDEDSVPF